MIRIQNIQIAVFFFLLIQVLPVTQAQVGIGARGIALGNATTALENYEWAIYGNPALLSSTQKSIGFYGLRYYGLAEITDISATLSVPTNWGVAALAFHRYGGDIYSETRIRVGYKNEWERFNMGLLVNYNHLSFGGDYGSGGALTVDVGIAAQLSENLWLGAKSVNITQSVYQFQGYDEGLYQDLSIGMSYHLAEKALFSVDLVKDVRFPVSWRGGVEIEIVEALVGRVGVSTEPITYSYGLGYAREAWSINLAVQQHEVLGTSPGLDIILRL